MGGDVALSCRITANPIVASGVGMYLGSGTSGLGQRPLQGQGHRAVSTPGVPPWILECDGGRWQRLRGNGSHAAVLRYHLVTALPLHAQALIPCHQPGARFQTWNRP